MKEKSYDVLARSSAASNREFHVEQIRNRYDTISPDLPSSDKLNNHEWRDARAAKFGIPG
ncbi:hypothetical protein [Rhizobium leguminosarum]|uniref:hypothetical protein n=1 Tax=Rhizobium leguminosarum TaxID=384 RepID=UPI0014429ACC|nr:hypothetical protein [Rhizobium leguminosarum]MBY5866555.1 hypothetical protein [Rhizobium leguminosarum]NKM07011.1 hypothetical protein [Rhizobium leguminosarum bv. viciae]